LRSFLRRLPDKTESDGLKQIHSKVARPVERQAKIVVPKRTGALAASIRRAKGSTKAATVRAGGARVPYAGPIHFGWKKHGISPQPFLSDALDDRHEQVLDMYQYELDRFIGQLMVRANLKP
jgi:hypothetical protein